jgi:hypothetical protein
MTVTKCPRKSSFKKGKVDFRSGFPGVSPWLHWFEEKQDGSSTRWWSKAPEGETGRVKDNI